MSEFFPLVNGLFGLTGVIVGAVLTRHSAKQQQKTANTFLLHKELVSKEMNQFRFLAEELINKYPFERLDSLDRRLSVEETTPLWNLMDFYMRLWVSLKHHQLQDKLVPELFGNIFIWWYINCFDKQLKEVDWEHVNALGNLRQWLERHATKREYSDWTARAQRHYRQRMESRQTGEHAKLGDAEVSEPGS